MAGSLKTAFFNLVKYAANDITSWLTDFNGNMDKIDTALNQNKTAAQAAQDAVDNLESEYETVTQTLSNHTNSIEANEKAIAKNASSISELGDEVNNISIGELQTFSLEQVTKIETLVEAEFLSGRNLGGSFSGTFSCAIGAGTLHSYDRNLVIKGSTVYMTDLVRISGNPFNIDNNPYQLSGIWSYTDGTSMGAGFYLAVVYIPGSNFTVIGYCSAVATPVEFSKKTILMGSC